MSINRELKILIIDLYNIPGINDINPASVPDAPSLDCRHMPRSLNLNKCADDIFERQMWRFEKPQERSGSVMPFAD